MPDSLLPSRLSHLLISEDTRTGRLFLPDGTDYQDTIGPTSPLTPSTSTFAFEATSLLESKALPRLSRGSSIYLPDPIGLSERRSQQLPALPPIGRDRLSTSSETRPPQTAPLSIPSTAYSVAPRTSSPPLPYHGKSLRPSYSGTPVRPISSNARLTDPEFMPHSAPETSTWSSGIPPPFLSYPRPLQTAPIGSGFPGRTELFGRSATLSYVDEQEDPESYFRRPTTEPQASPSKPFGRAEMIDELAPLGGSRAPISRTTKACNACRSRKVRCDAGGLPNGEPSTCSRCRESGVECVYSGAQKKRGPCPGSIRGGIRARRPSRRESIVEYPDDEDRSMPELVRPARTSMAIPNPSTNEWTSLSPRALPGRRRSSNNSSVSDLRRSSLIDPLDASSSKKQRRDSNRDSNQGDSVVTPATVLSWPQIRSSKEGSLDEDEIEGVRRHSDESPTRPKRSEDMSRRASAESQSGERDSLRISISRKASYFKP